MISPNERYRPFTSPYPTHSAHCDKDVNYVCFVLSRV